MVSGLLMDYPRLELMVAVDENWAIGKDNQLPWFLPTESAYFLKMTQQPARGKQHAAIFGRRTWLSIPVGMRPWKNCISYVLSTTLAESELTESHNVVICRQFQDIINHLRREDVRQLIDRIWVHGGVRIFAAAFRSPLFHRLYITRIGAIYPADVFFPAIDFERMRVLNDEEVDEEVPRGVQTDGGVDYRVFVYQSIGLNPLIE